MSLLFWMLAGLMAIGVIVAIGSFAEGVIWCCTQLFNALPAFYFLLKRFGIWLFHKVFVSHTNKSCNSCGAKN